MSAKTITEGEIVVRVSPMALTSLDDCDGSEAVASIVAAINQALEAEYGDIYTIDVDSFGAREDQQRTCVKYERTVRDEDGDEESEDGSRWGTFGRSTDSFAEELADCVDNAERKAIEEADWMD